MYNNNNPPQQPQHARPGVQNNMGFQLLHTMGGNQGQQGYSGGAQAQLPGGYNGYYGQNQPPQGTRSLTSVPGSRYGAYEGQAHQGYHPHHGHYPQRMNQHQNAQGQYVPQSPSTLAVAQAAAHRSSLMSQTSFLTPSRSILKRSESRMSLGSGGSRRASRRGSTTRRRNSRASVGKGKRRGSKMSAQNNPKKVKAQTHLERRPSSLGKRVSWHDQIFPNSLPTNKPRSRRGSSK